MAPRIIRACTARSIVSGTGRLLLGAVLCTVQGCATQVGAAGPDAVAVQIGVTDRQPDHKAMRIAQEHCATYGKKAVLQRVRDQVIFEFACR